MQPLGTQIVLNDDGTAEVIEPDAHAGPAAAGHFDNLADFGWTTPGLTPLCLDLLESIEQDKESRSERDRQYTEGLNRTGMGSNVVGGADFPVRRVPFIRSCWKRLSTSAAA